ncbi:MAG: diguanylate cyclase [Leptospirillia bacterium]
MSTKESHKYAAGTETWQLVQDGLAQVARQALGRFSGSAGVPNTPISLDNPVCHLMREHPETAGRCRSQCDHGVAKTIETGRTQLFKCHAQLSVFITEAVSQTLLPNGAAEVLLGGKVFTSYEDIHAFHTYAETLGIDPDRIESLIPDIRLLDLADVKQFLEQARQVGAAFMGMERSTDAALDQSARFRYLMEILTALEMEPASERARSILHGLGILFNAGASMLLKTDESGAHLKPETVFSGNSPLFSDAILEQILVDAQLPWVQDALSRPEGTSLDAVYDILKAGFPAEVTLLELFPIPGALSPGMVVLINTVITPEDRAAISLFCRHAGLLMEKEALEAQLEDQFDMGSPQISPTLWEASDADTLCQAILEKAIQEVAAEQGSVMLLDATDKRMHIRAIHGINPKYVEYVRIRRGEGISGRVLATGEPLLVEDIAVDPIMADQMRPRYRTRSFISIPIQLNNHPLGVINVTDKKAGSTFSRQDLKRLIPISQQAALAIDRMQALKETEALKKASITDYLTGLLNRGSFDVRFKEEVERAQRYPYASPLSLLVVDIDDFRRINDSMGYFTGDDCIKACSRTLEAGTRTIDSVYRRGGEEFTVLLPHTNREAALVLAERLCQSIASLKVVSKHTPDPVSFTVSIGLATYPEDGENEEELFKRGNQALHFAKQNGKNQVVTLPPKVQNPTRG